MSPVGHQPRQRRQGFFQARTVDLIEQAQTAAGRVGEAPTISSVSASSAEP